MADRPILFSSPMIRALLEGQKTMTRRVLKPQPAFYGTDDVPSLPTRRGCTFADHLMVTSENIDACTPYSPGDRLWVREAWAANEAIRRPQAIDNISYRADYAESEPPAATPITVQRLLWLTQPNRYRPSIHMPRKFSRLTLIVESVKVERLQDITFRDLEREGVVPSGECWGAQEAHEAWIKLWDSINGPGAWNSNPWVVAIGFSVVRANIDSLPPAPEVGNG